METRSPNCCEKMNIWGCWGVLGVGGVVWGGGGGWGWGVWGWGGVGVLFFQVCPKEKD